MAKPKETSGYVQLREAIKKKDKEKARNLLLNNVTVYEPNVKGISPLHWAIIKFDDLEIITMLLDRNADIYAKNQNNEKPLDVAIQKNKTQAAILLIERGALIGQDMIALRRKAIRKNNHTIVKILDDYGVQDNPSGDIKNFLNTAICKGQLEKIKQLKPHCQFLKSSERYIPQEVVIKSGQNYRECVELLLNWNFAVNPASNQDGDFIYAAVEKGYLPIVLQLLKLGIDVNMVNSKTGLNLLKVACLNKHHEIVENLLKHNASVNDTTPTNVETLNNLSYYCKHIAGSSSTYHEKNFNGITCLHIAVLNADPIMTRLLLSHSAKIIDDPKFFNITCIAIHSNDEEIVRIFIDYGVNVSDVDAQGKSFLHFCVNTRNGQDSRYKIAKLLLEEGGTSHLQTPGNSLIYEAITNGHSKIAELFLDYNANIQYISSEGNTSLHIAIEKNFDVDFIEHLLYLNSPVNIVNNNMLTPLLVACLTESTNQLDILETLLFYKANVNYAIRANCVVHRRNIPFTLVRGQTPLHIVCNYKNDMTASIIQLLLQHKANIEAVDSKGWTPLFVACEAANDVAVKCLLDNGANVNHTDSENRSSLYIAVKHYKDDSKVVKILLDHNVNVNFIDDQGKSIIHFIVANDNPELIKFLADTPINFNTADKQGKTPLHSAIDYGCADVILNLIKYGANINIQDKKNRTPLENAMEHMYNNQSKYQEYCDHQDFYLEHGYTSVCLDEADMNHYENVMNKYKRVIKALKTQVVKLNVAQLEVNNKNLDLVYNSSSYNRYIFFNNDEGCKIDVSQLEEDCEQEIKKMRVESVGINNMTFYDLLKKNIQFLSKIVKNKKIQQTLEQKVYDDKFPLYMDIVRTRFRDAKIRYRLVNSAKKYFH